MLKDILIKTAELINRDDIIAELKKYNHESNEELQNDIYRMISYYNYTIEKLCENYFNLCNQQTFISDKDCRINYLSFAYEPLKILSVIYENKPVYFNEYVKYLAAPKPCTSYTVTYKYNPDKLDNLACDIILPHGATEKIICYGIASEFLASKNQIELSEYWNNKFMFEIFKSKTSKDRKLKKTFLL